jgi:ribosomal protein S18 acetylase RimI-like enzyme
LTQGRIPTATDPIRVDDPESVRDFLESDPIEKAFPLYWTFHRDNRDIYADGLPPRAVLTMGHDSPPFGFRFCTLAARDAETAGGVLGAASPGPASLFVSDLGLLDTVKSYAEVESVRPAWLYRLDPEDFVDAQAHEVRAVPFTAAPLIVRLWDPEWDAVPYVRSRLESGPSFGIFEGDRPVAWYATHAVTDRVTVMGFLHVLDEFRHRGYARSLSCALIKEIFRTGRIPACHVYIDNEPSLRLMDSLGMRRVKQQAFVEVEFRHRNG